MLTRYGFGAIYIGDKEYKISPTFQNIDRLGTPKEIVETFTSFFNCPSINWQYHRAVEILQACCKPKLPDSVTGRFKVYENGKMKLINPPNNDFMHDIIVLASHCLKYGVIGVVNSESSEQAEPIKKFDAYHFIGLACEHLGRTREQAADMTLTEFMMAWDTKFPEQKKEREEKARKAKALNALMEYQKELDKKAALKRAAKQIKQ
ncbi:MAG TPA: DUF6246 family protein [Psychromonas sp.]